MIGLKKLIKTTIREFLNEGLDDTSWVGHNEETVTLRQILDLTKDIKVQELETEKLKKIVLSWDGNTEEIEKIEKSDIQIVSLKFFNKLAHSTWNKSFNKSNFYEICKELVKRDLLSDDTNATTSPATFNESPVFPKSR